MARFRLNPFRFAKLLTILTWFAILIPLLVSALLVFLIDLDDLGAWKQYILFADVAVIVFLIVWKVPKLQVPARTWDARERFTIENAARTTIVQVVGGFSILLTLYALVQTSANTARTLDLSRSANMADRFTKAIEQLGALDGKNQKKMEVRLGGIYALEAVARQGPEYNWQVMEVLSEYVRQNSSVFKCAHKTQPCAVIRASRLPANQTFRVTATADVEAILTVVARRIREQDYESLNAKPKSIFLRNMGSILPAFSFSMAAGRSIDFRGVDLHGTLLATGQQRNFEGVDFSLSNLASVRWGGIDMDGAVLDGVCLDEAQLWSNNMRHARFIGASLRGAVVDDGVLTDADFTRADLTCADIVADLTGATLTEAHLEGSWLKTAAGEADVTAQQIASACIDEQTVLPPAAARRPRAEGPCR